MSLSEGDLALIEKFIDSNLSPEETDLLNARLKDKVFAAELRLQQTAVESLRHSFNKQLKAELKQSLPREIYSTRRNPFLYGKLKYYYLAAAISLIAVVSSILLTRSHNSSEEIFLAHYKPYPIAPVTRGDVQASLHQAFEKYGAADYQQAAILFEQLISENSGERNVVLMHLLLGNCYLNINELEKASDSFSTVKESHERVFDQHGEWYYALTLLKAGNTDDALSEFIRISNSNSIYARQADMIVADLK